jgi:hypothetical protein
MIKGILIKEYQGNRQYSLRANHKATVLKQHSLRKYIKDIDSIAFANPDSHNKPKRTGITTFRDLINAMDEVSSSGTWSEAVCFITAVKTSSKNYYISCPKCKKKVTEVENANCVSCDHFYEHAKYRYIMNMNVADYTDSVWINAYDETTEVLMGIPAQQFAELKEEELQEHIKRIKYRHWKLRLVTKNEEFNGIVRKKTTIIKILDLNYADETRLLLDKLKQLTAN